MKENLVKRLTRTALDKILKKNEISNIGSRSVIESRVLSLSYTQIKKSL